MSPVPAHERFAMNILRDIPAATRFLPPSPKEFAERARHVCWLLEEPLQRCQELLARIYGYGDLHELQAAMARGDEPGPYSSCVADVDRSNRSIHFMLSVKGDTRQLPSHKAERYWRIRDIELFHEPSRHRRAWRETRAAVDGEEAALSVQPNPRPTADYAVLVAGEPPDYFRFTPLGQGVFNLAKRRWDDYFDLALAPQIRAEACDALQEISEGHPNNPWALTAWLDCEADRSRLSHWSTHKILDADPGHTTHTRESARWLLPKAQLAVSLFEALISDHPPEFDAAVNSPDDGDTDTFPVALHLAGHLSLLCEDFASAKRYLMANRKLCPRDEFGTRYLLCAIALVTNAKIPKLPSDDQNLWHLMALAAQSARERDVQTAIQHFAHALCLSYAPLEPFSRPSECRDSVWLGINTRSPAHVQEFMHLTQRFWMNNAEVFNLFAAMALRHEVRGAVFAFHQEYHPPRETLLNSRRDLTIDHESAAMPFRRKLEALLFEAVGADAGGRGAVKP